MITPSPQTLSFVLPTSLTIETVEECWGALKALPLAAKTALKLEASALETISTPGIQTIVALEKMLSASGGTLAISGQSQQLTRAFQEIGLTGFLEKLS